MNLGAFLLVLGIVVAVLVHWGLGVVLIVVGAVLIFVPMLR